MTFLPRRKRIQDSGSRTIYEQRQQKPALSIVEGTRASECSMLLSQGLNFPSIATDIRPKRWWLFVVLLPNSSTTMKANLPMPSPLHQNQSAQ